MVTCVSSSMPIQVVANEKMVGHGGISPRMGDVNGQNSCHHLLFSSLAGGWVGWVYGIHTITPWNIYM